MLDIHFLNGLEVKRKLSLPKNLLTFPFLPYIDSTSSSLIRSGT